MHGKLIGLTLASGVCLSSAYAYDELLISEYIEGSSNNKAIELYNSGDTDIDLSQYQLKFYFNGRATAGSVIALEGNLISKGVYVVADDNANEAITSKADLLSRKNFFNGDDAIVLSKNDIVIDSIGQIGVDPGSEWGSGDLSTKDNTIRRAADQLLPDVNTNDNVDLSPTWEGFPKDDFSGLGQFISDGTNPDPDPDPDPTPDEFVCNAESTLISSIQGSSETSPLSGQTVTVEAIVTASFDGLKGLSLQMPQDLYDDNEETSEGIFVYSGSSPLSYQSGDVIRMKAKVGEFRGQTQLSQIIEHKKCGTSELPETTEVILPLTTDTQLESVEGMRVTFPQSLVVNNVYSLGEYGEVNLGSQRHFIGTQVAEPGDEAIAVQAANKLDTILLDDAATQRNPNIIRYPAPELSASNSLRAGDTTLGLTGIMSFAFGSYRLMPTVEPSFMQTNPRTSSPQIADNANLKVASYNVLNYFNGDGQGNDFPTSRGADTLAEFDKQSVKIVSAITAMDAAVIGIMEVENDGYSENSAIAQLVRSLNAASESQSYAFVQPQQTLGDDQISVGILYQPARVQPVGDAKVLNSTNSPVDDEGDQLFDDGKNRPMLTQAFKHIESQQELVIAVNHLKSKGSNCNSLGDPDMGDGQGNCNMTRTRAAHAIAQWLNTEYPELDQLIIGDLNAYVKEDPINALTSNGYVELFNHLEKSNAYSYSFRGESGSLDHAIVNAGLADNVVDVTAWHINADEPRVIDYNEENKTDEQLQLLYANDAYRSSDHDPIIVSLLLEADNIEPVANFTTVVEGNQIQLVSQSTDEDGEIVSHEWDLGDGTVLSGSNAAHIYQQFGEYQITLTVTDNAGSTHQSTQTVVIEDLRQKPIADFYQFNGWFFDLFFSTSYDLDGKIIQNQWKFSDGHQSSGWVSFRFWHYADKVELSVTDNDGLTSSKTKNIR